MLGSIPNASPWHGVWHWLMEDATPAPGALALANATRSVINTAAALLTYTLQHQLYPVRCTASMNASCYKLVVELRYTVRGRTSAY